MKTKRQFLKEEKEFYPEDYKEVGEYLKDVKYGQGFVTFDKIEMDIKNAPYNFTLADVLEVAERYGFKVVKLRSGDALVQKGASVNEGLAKMSKEDQGCSDKPAYADAIRDLEETEKAKEEYRKLPKADKVNEKPKRPKMVPGAKKMHLDESLFEEVKKGKKYIAFNHFDPEELYFVTDDSRFDYSVDVTNKKGQLMVSNNDEDIEAWEHPQSLKDVDLELYDDIKQYFEENPDENEYYEEDYMFGSSMYREDFEKYTRDTFDWYSSWVNNSYVDGDSNSQYQLINIDEIEFEDPSDYDEDDDLYENKNKENESSNDTTFGVNNKCLNIVKSYVQNHNSEQVIELILDHAEILGHSEIMNDIICSLSEKISFLDEGLKSKKKIKETWSDSETLEYMIWDKEHNAYFSDDGDYTDFGPEAAKYSDKDEAREIAKEHCKKGYRIERYYRDDWEDQEETCCICGERLGRNGGHNAEPVENGKCCDKCNIEVVIPERKKMSESVDAIGRKRPDSYKKKAPKKKPLSIEVYDGLEELGYNVFGSSETYGYEISKRNEKNLDKAKEFLDNLDVKYTVKPIGSRYYMIITLPDESDEVENYFHATDKLMVAGY